MALSGRTGYAWISNHTKFWIEWTGTQSVSGNYTDITAKAYIEADSYGAIYSSAQKDGGTEIIANGNSQWFYWTVPSGALSANEKKLLATETRRVYHNADGTATVGVDGFYDIEITFSGTYYGRLDVAQDDATLNTIPRKSTLASSPSWTAGNNLGVTIDRASTDFVHTVYVYVNGQLIASKGNVGASTTFNFSTSENTTIFNELNGGSSQDTKITLVTYPYAGGSSLGQNDYVGTITAPSASTVASGFDMYRYVDEGATGGINRANSGFTHTVKFYINGTLIRTMTGVSTSFDFNPTSGEISSMYAQMPSDKIKDGNIEITTYYNGEIVRSPVNVDIDWYARNVEPVFNSGQVSYDDSNTTTTTITGNNQYIVQDKSTLVVHVNSSATMQQSASFTKYVISVGGVEKTLTTATGSVTVGNINAGSNQTLSVKAVDSRGYSTTVYKTVLVVPYSDPKVNITTQRNNNFESDTVLSVDGDYSKLVVGGVTKNVLSAVEYRYKEQINGTWTSWTALTYTTNNGTFTANDVLITLDNTKRWDVEVRATDKLVTNTETDVVGTGEPIFFIDSDKKTVSINMLPELPNMLEVNGGLRVVDGATFGLDVIAEGGKFYGGLDSDGDDILVTLGGNLRIKPYGTSAPNAGIFGADNTGKAYVYFDQVSGSNDPAFIMHETSSVSTSNNKGVLHICPSDDNDNVNDYVTIHGTNDPETIKLYTGGDIYTTGGITANRIRVTTTADVTETSSNNGLIIGHPSSGESLKMDTNELHAFNNGSPSDLHINNTGGTVFINDLNGYTGGVGLQMFNSFRVLSNGGIMELHGNDHGYMEFFTKGHFGSRTAYFGFGSASTDDFQIVNQLTGAKIRIQPAGASFEFQKDGSHSTLRAENQAGLKWLSSSDTVQVRTTTDVAYGTLQAVISDASDRRIKRNINPVNVEYLKDVVNTQVYTYNLKGKPDSEIAIGLIADEAPDKIVIPEQVDEFGEPIEGSYAGINLYAMATFLWKAVQELAGVTKSQQADINQLIAEVKNLKSIHGL